MPLISFEAARAFAVAALCAHGTSAENAAVVADQLIEAEATGHGSHGLRLIQMYVDRLRAGDVDGSARPLILDDNGAVIRVDGNRAFGQIVGRFSAELGSARAREIGICLVLLRNSGHLGRNGKWAEVAAEAGVVSLHFAHGNGGKPNVVPHGSADAVLRTSPVALGVPGEGAAMILDFATSETSANSVKLAAERGERLSGDFLVLPGGVRTDDPVALTQGAGIAAFGGYKGYGIGVFAELLGALLPIGSDTTRNTNSMASIYIDASLSQAPGGFPASATRLFERLREATPAPGFDRVTVPGDRSNAARAAANGASGIVISNTLCHQLRALSERSSVAN